MLPGALGNVFHDRKAPMERLTEVTHAIQGEDEKAPWAAQLFGGGGRDYQERYGAKDETFRSEEHTSELQSLMRISYAVFCLKKKKDHNKQYNTSKSIQIHKKNK